MTQKAHHNPSDDIKQWINLQMPAEHSACAVGEDWLPGDSNAPVLESFNPSDGACLGSVRLANAEQCEMVLARSERAFQRWRLLPAPKRGEFVARLRDCLIRDKDRLGSLVALEMGKPKQEGDGEVQEMIDMADFAIGQSRMLYGKTMPSERPGHRLLEQWQPLGVVLVITAFNFPVAVWAWNAMIALIAGNAVIWKPSSKTPLCAIAVMQLCQEAFEGSEYADVLSLLMPAEHEQLQSMVDNAKISLVSFTGSTAVGKQVNTTVAARMGRCLLECGGNNAMIVTPSANLDLTLPAITFAAIGTAGQRCTSLRRLLVQRDLYEQVVQQLQSIYAQIRVGDPLNPDHLMGPLIDQDAVDQFTAAIQSINDSGGTILFGGSVLDQAGFFVEPTLVAAQPDWPLLQLETFAPILYVMPYDDLSEAVQIQNNVPQGLSSALFSQDIQEMEYFLSAAGSDCGIANINIGTSGAEIGGAFGGEKETGGGREAGSDAWKTYMRRQTVTINGSDDLPLAQGIEFKL